MLGEGIEGGEEVFVMLVREHKTGLQRYGTINAHLLRPAQVGGLGEPYQAID